MAIEHVNSEEDYNKIVAKSDKLVIIDFWAPWCGPCKMLGPHFEKAAEEYKNVVFVKVNVDEAQDVAAKFGIRSIPTLFLVKEGEIVDQKFGAQNLDGLKSFIDSKL